MTKSQLVKIKTLVKQQLAKTAEPLHDWHHLERVKSHALYLADNYKRSLDRNLLAAICYLHDIAYFKKRPAILVWAFEGKYARNDLDKLFPTLGLAQSDFDVIYEAIINHPHSFPFRRLNKGRSIYAQLLQDADTLDLVNKKRVKVFSKKMLFLFPLIFFLSLILKKHLRFFLNRPELITVDNVHTLF